MEVVINSAHVSATAHRLPLLPSMHGSLSWGVFLQEQIAPAWIPQVITSPASKPSPTGAPFSLVPQVLLGHHLLEVL